MKHKVMLILVAFASVVVCDSARSQTYTITDLGPLSPTAINTWGQVVGTVNDHAVIWTKFGGRRDLGLLPGGTFSHATAINDLGWVTGTADGMGTVLWDPPNPEPNFQCSNLIQPFLWKPRTGMQALGTVVGKSGFGVECSTAFYGLGINDPGQVVGYTEDVGITFQWAFMWTGASGMDLLGTSWPPTQANGVNNRAQVVGQDPVGLFNLMSFGHAVSWTNGIMTDLGVLVKETDPNYGGYFSSATGVNDLGQIVGWASTSPWIWNQPIPFHAVLWTRTGEIRDLGTLPGTLSSAALKINLFGQVIGSSGNTVVGQDHGEPGGSIKVVGRPFVWSERYGLRDLNTFVPSPSGWILNSAADINIWGQIVGSGTRNGQPHGFLLTPRRLFGY